MAKKNDEQQQVDEIVAEQVTNNAEQADEVPGPGQWPGEVERDEMGKPVAKQEEQDAPPVVNASE